MDNFVLLAINILREYKRKIDQARLAVEEGMLLKRKLEILEVTIGMIPRRNEGGSLSTSQVPAIRPPTILPRQNIREMFGELVRLAVEQLSEFVEQQGLSLPLEIGQGIFSGEGINRNPLDLHIPSRGQSIVEFRKSGASDIEVSFLAMKYIIFAAVQIINESMDDLLNLQEFPSYCYWIPCITAEQNKLRKKIHSHFTSIDQFHSQLQTAISVASYCVSLTQLENALNATNIIDNPSVREFWKQNFGVSETRVPISQLLESFMSAFDAQFDRYKKDNGYISEKIVKMRDNKIDVVLNRFLSTMWNSNGDNHASVFEVNNATKAFGKKQNAIALTGELLLELRKGFLDKILFNPFFAMEHDEFVALNDYNPFGPSFHEARGLHFHPSDKILFVSPFDRLRILSQVPVFDSHQYEYDFISLLKFRRITNLRHLLRASRGEICFEEMEDSRAFVSAETNYFVIGKHNDSCIWNAPVSFKDRKGDLKTIPGFTGKRTSNFETKRLPKALKRSLKHGNTSVTLNDIGVSSSTTILYTPTIKTPGVYTVRYCLHDTEINEMEQAPNLLRKGLAVAGRTYYYNRYPASSTGNSVDVDNIALQLINYRNGFGDSNYVTFLRLLKRLKQIEMLEAKKNHEMNDLRARHSDFADIDIALTNIAKHEREQHELELQSRKRSNSAVTPRSRVTSPRERTPSETEPCDSLRMESMIVQVAQSNDLMTTGSKKMLGDNKTQNSAKPEVDESGDSTKLHVEAREIPKVKFAETNDPKSFADAAIKILKEYNDKTFESRFEDKNINDPTMDPNRAIEIQKVFLSMEIEYLMCSVHEYHLSSFQQWYNSFNSLSVDKSILRNVELSYHVLQQLEDIRVRLLPSNYPVKNNHVVLLFPKEESEYTTPIIDVDKECTQSACASLPIGLFSLFYQVKCALIALDAKETFARHNFRRLKVLNSFIEDLQYVLSSKRLAKVGGKHLQDRSKSRLEPVINQITTLISGIKDKIEGLMDKVITINHVVDSNLQSINKIEAWKKTERVKQLKKVLEELDSTASRLKSIIDPEEVKCDSATYDDSRLAKHLEVPSLGLIIVVQDVPALAWGNKFIPNADMGNDDRAIPMENTPNKTNKQLKNALSFRNERAEWRIIVDNCYPFEKKNVLTFRKSRLQDSKALTFGVFFNIGNGNIFTQETGPAESEDANTIHSFTTEAEETSIRKSNPGSQQPMMDSIKEVESSPVTTEGTSSADRSKTSNKLSPPKPSLSPSKPLLSIFTMSRDESDATQVLTSPKPSKSPSKYGNMSGKFPSNTKPEIISTNEFVSKENRIGIFLGGLLQPELLGCVKLECNNDKETPSMVEIDFHQYIQKISQSRQLQYVSEIVLLVYFLAFNNKPILNGPMLKIVFNDDLPDTEYDEEDDDDDDVKEDFLSKERRHEGTDDSSSNNSDDEHSRTVGKRYCNSFTSEEEDDRPVEEHRTVRRGIFTGAIFDRFRTFVSRVGYETSQESQESSYHDDEGPMEGRI